MAEDGPGKSDADGSAGAPEASATGRKTPEVREEAATPADPSPPKLAPEAPTRTPEKREIKEENGDGKPTTSSPPQESPPTLTQQPPQQLQQATPQAPHQPKPRGRPPGIPNKTNAATLNQQMAMHNQMTHHLAQQTAAMMHRNGHGVPQNMPMPQMIQVNADGQQQFVQIIPGPGPGQFMQQMFPGRARFPVPHMRPPPPQPRPQQQMQQPPGGPNQTVPVLIPVPSGQSSNPLVVPNSAVIRNPDGTMFLRQDFVPKQQQGFTLNHHYTDANGQVRQRQLQLTAAQSMQLQHAISAQKAGGNGNPPQLIIHHQQQQQHQRAANDLQHLQQQQQLTRQNLDRLASGAAAAGSSGSRTLDWVGGLPPPASNGNGAPSLLQPMPQLQHLQQITRSPAEVEKEEEEDEAAPQLAAEAALNLNVESLNAEEAFQQESHGGHHGRRKNAGKNTKTFVHEIDGHKIIETTEPSNSTHLDVDDFEPVPDDDDDQSDKSYEGKEEDVGPRKPNGANPGFVDQAAQWMQNRLEMDIPRDERKTKKEPVQPHKPATRADGKKAKRGGRKSNELKSLIQMDFGPAENSRRAQDMLPTLIKTATLKEKESAKNLRNTTERRSNSAAGGSIAAAAKGKESRSLRNRDSTEKTRECRACGNALDEKKTDKHRGYCNELCSRISRSPMNTEGEDDETTSERTEQTPEPTNRKKESSSTPNSGSKRRSTIEVKEEPMEEVTTTPKRKGRGKKEPEEMMVLKKEIVTPKKEEKKKEEKNLKKEVKEEDMEEEKQQSPAVKKRAGQEKRADEPPTKMRKVDSLHAAPAACESPALVAALTAPPVYSQQMQPVQQQQQARLPAVVAEVGPLPVVAAAAALPAVPAATAAPTAPEMDSVTCRQLTVEQVRAWVERITGKPEIAQQFASEDVDGETLLTLKYNDLRDDLKLSLGMAKKVYSAIEEICKRKPTGSDE